MTIGSFHHFQFNANYAGEFILIYDENSTLISRLTSSDDGPKLNITQSNWDKKIISSTSNKVLIEFRSDDKVQHAGFLASIQFTQQQSECESWLDMKQRNLSSPNYPNIYNNITSCEWLIIVTQGHYIELKFQEFNVSYLNNSEQ